jgi:hypothetical protein
MNHLGKGLVLVNLAISIVLLTWALILFVQPVDWGWKEARKAWGAGAPEGKNERIAAKIDERTAAYTQMRNVRGMVVARVQPAEAALAQTEGHFGYNHLFYRWEMKRLAEEKGPVKVAAVQYNKDGSVATEGNKPWGRPAQGPAVNGIEKSYAAYLEDLKAKDKELKTKSKALAGVLDKQEKLTVQLNGVHDKDGKVVEPGLYDLLEEQAQLQSKLKAEREHQQPLWVYELYSAQLLRSRRLGLEKRLRELGEDPSRVLQK